MNRILLITVLGFSLVAAASAFAGEGYIVGGADLRAGPDNSYPSVGMLNSGAVVTVEGCVSGWSWCDVATPVGRGWVTGNVLQEEYQGQRVLVPEYGPQIGIVFVTFDFATYWDANYRSRPWYGQRARYAQIRPQVAVDVNIRTQPARAHARDEHGTPKAAAPARPVAQARAPEKNPAHAKPAVAKTAPPKTEDAKAQPKPSTEGDKDKGDKGDGQH